MNKIKRLMVAVFTIALLVCVSVSLFVACDPTQEEGNLTVTIEQFNANKGSVTLNKTKFFEGEEVVVTVQVNSGYELRGLYLIVGNEEQNVTQELVNGEYKFNITQDCMVAVDIREVDKYVLSISEFDDWQGEVAISPVKQLYDKGEQVTVTVQAKTGYALESFAIGNTDLTDQLVNGEYTFAITADGQINVAFVPTVTYTLDVTELTADQGTVTVSPLKDAYGTNEKVTVTVAVKIGYTPGAVTVNGVAASGNNGVYELTITQNTSVNIELGQEDLTVIEAVTADQFRAMLNRKGVILVDFWAEWCGACIDTEPEVEKLAEANLGIKIVKIDIGPVDQQPPERYLFFEYTEMFDNSNSEIPYFVLFVDGQPVAGKTSFVKIPYDALYEFVTSNLN